MLYSLFHDRRDAGNQLAQALSAEVAKLDAIQPRFVVYALPRGGLPVAAPIAQRLNCPLDVIVAKKVTRPDYPELAIGAVTADGHVIRSRREAFTLWSSGSWRVALGEAQEKAQAQLAQFAAYRPNVDAEGAIVILVDDGIATGMTIALAARALRALRPALLLLCAPVAPGRLLKSLGQWGDRVVVLAMPETFSSVSRFYQAFPQVEMAEAIECLVSANEGCGNLEAKS